MIDKKRFWRKKTRTKDVQKRANSRAPKIDGSQATREAEKPLTELWVVE
jgi:hypothetical protein